MQVTRKDFERPSIIADGKGVRVYDLEWEGENRDAYKVFDAFGGEALSDCPCPDPGSESVLIPGKAASAKVRFFWDSHIPPKEAKLMCCGETSDRLEIMGADPLSGWMQAVFSMDRRHAR